MNRLLHTLALLVLLSPVLLPAQEELLLYPQGAPGAIGQEPKDKPSLFIYLADVDKATGAAVMICPGGGYGHLAMEKEGTKIAQWYNSLGVHAFVLKYRLGNPEGTEYQHPAMLNDARRGLRIIRSGAQKWGIDPDRIGVMGFSAGGHLASTLGTHFDDGRPEAEDPVERVSCLPNFMVLAYPVISLNTKYVHAGSRRNLLGATPRTEDVDFLSNETQVKPLTPPAFLFHTDADTAVPAENSVRFYLALREAGIPAELHIYEKGRHGVGFAPDDPVLSTWKDRLADWLKNRGVVAP
ncbi:MAG: alpha/beta hydrolase [Lewinellaceae bacterium]|nr:alpha/beta hydrolase [Lewinellaceae bacterium]MCB9287244.1 alpha/beta hydrolase [Lewinellaceae bacterium]